MALKGVEFPFCIQCLSIAALVVVFYLHSISSYVLDVFSFCCWCVHGFSLAEGMLSLPFQVIG